MTTTLVLPAGISDHLRQLGVAESETGGVLLVRVVVTPSGGLRLLARELHVVPDDAYETRTSHGLKIRSEGFVPPLRRAEETGCAAIWMHTHPGDGASLDPSWHDRRVDEQIADLFRLRTGSDLYGALIVGSGLRFSGHVEQPGERRAIDRMLAVGPRLSLRMEDNATATPLLPLFDRNIRAFGGAIQAALGQIRVAIVGCGGTGSAVAEQLVRLGVRHLLLIDPEDLSATNTTRVYGSTPATVGRPKVEVAADHLQAIAPDLAVVTVADTVTDECAARALLDYDVIFGCTDDHAGRLVMARFGTWMMTPVIDCGVLLSSDGDGEISGIDGRVTKMYPGAACLVCRGRVDLQRAARDALPPAERAHRIAEGYAPALETPAPAVIAYTTAVAATAVAELIEMLVGYGPDPPPSEVLLRLHERELSTNVLEPQPGHWCHPDMGKIGFGVTTPFLERTWSS
jgi:hypothetical protein